MDKCMGGNPHPVLGLRAWGELSHDPVPQPLNRSARGGRALTWLGAISQEQGHLLCSPHGGRSLGSSPSCLTGLSPSSTLLSGVPHSLPTGLAPLS